MNKKLLELLNAINAKKTQVRNLAEEGKLAEAAEAKKELEAMQQKFDLLKDIMEEETEQVKDALKNDTALNGKNPHIVTPASEGPQNAVEEFANAARRGFKVENAMTTGLREGSDPDGGYTVPEDIQTRINQYKTAEFSLETLIEVEPVKTEKGQRTYEKKSTMTGFAEIEEGEELSEMETPTFERSGYAIKARGGWLPVSNYLLADTDQNITEVITRWIARKSNATSNTNILKLVKSKEASEIETMDEVKKAIIVTLGAAYRANARILTNDDGLFFLSTLKDANGRDLLQPNPMDVMQMYLSVGPLRIPIVAVPNQVVASDIQTAGKLKIPMVCADFKEAFKKYDRQKTTLLSSNIASAGELNAFTQNLTLIRAIERNDYRVVDADAFVNLAMVTNATTTVEQSSTKE